MNTPTLVLTIDDGRRAFQPGETIAGEYRVETFAGEEPHAVEISVLWFTEGKGDEDMAVHFFERVENSDAAPADFRQPRRFSAPLPRSPLSYEGVIVKIRWCVRLRAFLPRGKQAVEESPFRLGDIPPARAVLP